MNLAVPAGTGGVFSLLAARAWHGLVNGGTDLSSCPPCPGTDWQAFPESVWPVNTGVSYTILACGVAAGFFFGCSLGPLLDILFVLRGLWRRLVTAVLHIATPPAPAALDVAFERRYVRELPPTPLQDTARRVGPEWTTTRRR